MSNLGDIVLSFSVLNAIIKKYGSKELEIDILTNKKFKELFECVPFKRKIYFFGKKTKRIKLFFEFLKNGYDIVIDSKNTAYSLLGKKHTSLLAPKKIKNYSHITEKYFLIHKNILGEKYDFPFEFYVCEDEVLNVKKAIDEVKEKGYKIIVIHGDSAWDKKVWPEEKYKELIRYILNKYDNTAVFLVGVKKRINMKGEFIYDFQEKTNLHELVYIIEKASLVISTDSGPMHIASVMDKPVLCFFGPIINEKFFPLSKIAKIIKCESEDVDCIKKIPAEKVIKSFDEIFSKIGG
jgi:ADP-heptose:LPS heptosyltransferase